MLNVVGVAALVIFMSLNPDWSLRDRRGGRRKLLKQLGEKLADKYIQIHIQNPRVLKLKLGMPENDWQA